MPWLTELLNRRVTDASGGSAGRVKDVAASRGRFPRVTGVVVKLDRGSRRALGSEGDQMFVPWVCLTIEPRQIRLLPGALTEPSPDDADLLLGDEILDSQIVDTDGAKVVRVNDVLLQESASGLRVVGADVGIKGILRQLNLERFVVAIADALGYRVPDRLIAWNYVAQLGQGTNEVQLSVPTRLLRELHPSELADILDQLDGERREQILRVMSAAHLAETLAESDPEVSRDAVQVLSDERVKRVIEAMPPDEATDLLGAIGYERAERLLNLMGLKQASILRELLGYPPESAGGRMTPSFVGISADLNAGEAIAEIRAQAREAETINYAYVVGSDRSLLGVLSLRQLLRAAPDRRVAELMETDVLKVNLSDDQEVAAKAMSRYNLLALPVVDDDGRLKGIVTVDDIVDILEEEASQDLSEVAGVYLGQGSTPTAGRLAGFGLSMVAGIIAAVLLRAQGPVLVSAVTVAWLLPVYLRMAQDLGTWSLARALSQGEDQQWTVQRTEVLAQELFAALLSAGFSGAIVGIFGAWVTGNATVSVFLGVGIFVGSLIASVIGLTLPTIARATGLSWMLARGRLLAVVVGLCSLLVYVWALDSLADRL